MNIKKHIPNFITSLALSTGLIALYFAMINDVNTTMYFLILASVFDFLDGAFARMLNVMSPMGKELDSLSDMVVFGLVPGMVLHSFAVTAMGFSYPLSLSEFTLTQVLAVLSPVLIVVFSALRLAKFNVDESQTYYFKGLPTPANALFVVSLVMVFREYGASMGMLEESVIFLSLCSAALLVSPIKLFSLKFKNFSLIDNWYRYLLLLSSIILIIVLGFQSIALVVVLFVLLSLFLSLTGAFES